MLRRRRLVPLALIIVLGLFAAACGGSAATGSAAATAAASTAPKVLNIAYTDDPTSLDPTKTPSVSLVHSLIYDTLVVQGADLQYHPDLATSWTISPDGKTITFKLRQDVKFQDGTPLNADAVKFTFDRIMNPATASPGKSFLGTLSSTTVLDPYTVQLNFSAPYAPIFNSLSTDFCAIISPTAAQKEGDNFGQQPVGTGPFAFKSWLHGQSITLVRNPDYKWGPSNYYGSHTGPAQYDQVVFKALPDENTRVLALKNDEVQISDVPATSLNVIQSDPNVQLVKNQSQGIDYLGFNVSRAPWSDQKVRAAIAHLIQRDPIVQVGLGGLGVPQYTPVPTNVWGFSQTAADQEYNYDPAAAKSLLESDGYTPGANGIMTKNGQPLSLTILTYTTEPYPRVAQVVQNQIQQGGIQVSIKELESASLLALTPTGNFDAILIAYGWSDPDILYYFFDSANLKTSNRVHLDDPSIDALLLKGRTTVDPTARAAVYQTLQEDLDQLAAWIPLYSTVSETGISKTVTGWQSLPNGSLLLLNAHPAGGSGA
jgi:peptide/nickel transport system substrate-binding protein